MSSKITERPFEDWRTAPTIGEACRIISDIPGSDKGKAFEKMLVFALPYLPELELSEAWHWTNVPDDIRSKAFPHAPHGDTGIDIVARRHDGTLIAIQAKCQTRPLAAGDLGTFMNMTGGNLEVQRPMVLTTCDFTGQLRKSIQNCSLINVQVEWSNWRLGPHRHKPNELNTQQKKAFQKCVKGLRNHDRGRLIMACGTGKTLVSQRVAETIAPEGGLVVYATPSIGLTAQSRREWLRHAKRPIHTMVICSDETAGKGEPNTGRTIEVDAPVHTQPAEITTAARRLLEAAEKQSKGYAAIFTTYQSMDKLCQAQSEYNLQDVDFVIADEAHHTAGYERKAGTNEIKTIKMVHNELRAQKRLYQTATPRIYSHRSVRKIEKSIETERKDQMNIIDMQDATIYGPLLHNLSFAEALEAPEKERRLCDYRVVVVLIDDAADTPAAQPESGLQDTTMGQRIAALSLVMNGADGRSLERDGELAGEPIRPINSCIAFCNTLQKARSARHIISDQRLTDWAQQHVSTADSAGDSSPVTAGYLDGNSSANVRQTELNQLRDAVTRGHKHVTTNVKVLSEGIDVPALDAVCFLEERKSEIDIVQAVGRVMRRSSNTDEGVGYIVVPIVMDPQMEFEETLSTWNRDWRVLGQVLRSLRAHDPRISTDLHKQLIVTGSGGGGSNEAPDFWERLRAGQFDKIIPQIMDKSGLRPSTEEETNLIKAAVARAATSINKETGLGHKLHHAVGVEDVTDKPDQRACAAAALILTNALLMHQRMNELASSSTHLRLTPLAEIAQLKEPEIELAQDWHRVLDRDFAPIFQPAQEVLEAARDQNGTMPEGMRRALRSLAEHCKEIATAYVEMGMDHAGELFQAAMDQPDADGAYYTLTPGAMLLAELACDAKAPPEDPLWRNASAWRDNCVLDPACGSGTLLVAFCSAVKRRAQEQGATDSELQTLYKVMVEDCLTGLDINKRAVQIGAAQLAVGAANAELERMGLFTMIRGFPESASTLARLGTLDLLTAHRDGSPRAAADKEQQPNLPNVSRQDASLQAENIDSDAAAGIGDLRNRLSKTSICISNPPYSNSAKEAGSLTSRVRQAIQRRKQQLRTFIAGSDTEMQQILNPNSLSPWFTVLMQELTDCETGVIAKVMPTTACTSVGGIHERKYWAENFHIRRIITLHDPKRPNWSAETDLTESLMIMAREKQGDTEFISLAQYPRDPEEVLELRELILAGTLKGWGMRCPWPAERMQAGDWSPAVWFHPELANACREIDDKAERKRWLRIGNAWDIQTTKEIVGKQKWQWCEKQDAVVQVTRYAGGNAQTKLSGSIDGWAKPTPSHNSKQTIMNLWDKAGKLHIANTQDAGSARLFAIVLRSPAVGYTWTPVQQIKTDEAKAVAVWLNSTPGRIAARQWFSRKATWPFWQPKAIQQIVAPDVRGNAGEKIRHILVQAFQDTRRMKVPQYRDGTCPVRETWDDAVSEATKISRRKIRRWAELLHKEPTIAQAPESPEST